MATSEPATEADAVRTAEPPRQVVYLIGAGASHACIKAVGSVHGILMRDLGQPLRELLHAIAASQYADDPVIEDLVNTVVVDDIDIEHIITFLDDSTSALHRRFADDLRKAFERVLKERLQAIEEELGAPPVHLYEALIDMHDVEGLHEELRGILTLNYDEYIEAALKNLGRSVDFGIYVSDNDPTSATARLLKLHGSFGWKHTWPVLRATFDSAPLWIPPGIQKGKGDYPFNALWGLARELLDCDLVRVIGCRLTPNDWDLISLLFTTRHTNARRADPYLIEIVNSPASVEQLRQTYPYLDIQSIFDREPMGGRLVSELIGGDPRALNSLSPEEAEKLYQQGETANWFFLWLRHMAEGLFESHGSVDTAKGVFKKLMEAI